MGLDLYAGTLTRYYANNWKSAARQWAEANGLSFSRITPDGEIVAEEEVSAGEVQCAVEEWRDQILAAVTVPGKSPMLHGRKTMKNFIIQTNRIGMHSGRCFW